VLDRYGVKLSRTVCRDETDEVIAVEVEMDGPDITLSIGDLED
jgi:hypothetical protein